MERRKPAIEEKGFEKKKKIEGEVFVTLKKFLPFL